MFHVLGGNFCKKCLSFIYFLLQDPLLQKFVKIVTEHSNGQLGEKIWIETCRRIKVRSMRK